MRTAFVFTDLGHQIVLTPENDFEKLALEGLVEGAEFKVRKGSFYACQGGWDRFGSEADDRSTIILITGPKVKS